jgi:hypothetical protein
MENGIWKFENGNSKIGGLLHFCPLPFHLLHDRRAGGSGAVEAALRRHVAIPQARDRRSGAKLQHHRAGGEPTPSSMSVYDNCDTT